MSESSFHFIQDPILRKNLDTCFDHVVELTSLLSEDRKDLNSSSLRKTIIIYTASIIEALLIHLLDKKIQEKIFLLKDEWKYSDTKVIHSFDNTEKEEIICTKRKPITKTLDQLDFLRVSELCLKHSLIKEELKRNIDTVRKHRNRIHIGGLTEIEKEFSHKDLEDAFKVAKEVKNILKKALL